MKAIDYVLNNFLLRNAAAFILVYGGSFLQRMAMKKESIEIVSYLYVSILFYSLCVFHNVVLYKRYFRQKKYPQYLLGLAIAIFMFQALILVQERYMRHLPFPPHTLTVWVSIFMINLSYITLGFAVYYSFNHYRDMHQQLNLQYMMRELELKQLKEQLNPHFLFNALNNIYSYSLEKNSYSKELVLKLGELMNFILTNADKDNIALKEEILFLENYIAFEKERLDDLCDIVYSKDIKDGHAGIAPLILFTLVENAFKHGTKTIDRSRVEICLRADANGVHLYTKNPVTEYIPGKKTNIGLANLRRRLELLYPGKYQLDIEANDKYFQTNFSLAIAS